MPLQPSPHLTSASIDQIYLEAGEFLRVEGGREVLTLTCTVVEGTFCWFGDEMQSGGLPRELARQVIDELGGPAVERANRNQVVVRCSRDAGGLSLTTCEADWGWGGGWERLPVD